MCAESIKLCPGAAALKLGSIKSTKASLFLKRKKQREHFPERTACSNCQFSKRDHTSTPKASAHLQEGVFYVAPFTAVFWREQIRDKPSFFRLPDR